MAGAWTCSRPAEDGNENGLDKQQPSTGQPWWKSPAHARAFTNEPDEVQRQQKRDQFEGGLPGPLSEFATAGKELQRTRGSTAGDKEREQDAAGVKTPRQQQASRRKPRRSKSSDFAADRDDNPASSQQ